MSQKRLLSGIQPTGDLHIGNYLGALKNFLELQDHYECYFMIATYHSITGEYDPFQKKKQILDLATDYLAAGIDPKKAVLFNQADVPAHTELCWIFNSLTPVSELERMTQFKDKSQKQQKNINMGLFDYPVLQAADILLYQSEVVPVGKDQEQHIELARKTVRWFNNKYKKEYFAEPRPLFTPVPKVMSLLEPEKKMSKSAGPNHYIAISDTPEDIEKKIKKAVTGIGTEDTTPPGAENLLQLMREFGAPDRAKVYEAEIKAKTVRYGDMKRELAALISDYFAEFRERRAELEKNPNYIKQVLEEGAKEAQKIAQKTLDEVKEIIGVSL